MLFKNKRKLDKLQESGTRAPATVTGVNHQGNVDKRNPFGDLERHPRDHWIDYKLDLRVTPEGAEPFDVTVRTRWYRALDTLYTGAEIDVLFDPDDPHDVVVDYEGALSRWEAGEQAVRDTTAPAFDRDAWIALVQEGEEAAEQATDPKIAAEINDLVGRFDGGQVTEEDYKARLAELTGPR